MIGLAELRAAGIPGVIAWPADPAAPVGWQLGRLAEGRAPSIETAIAALATAALAHFPDKLAALSAPAVAKPAPPTPCPSGRALLREMEERKC